MLQHEMDRNQELYGRIKKLEDRETEVARNLKEQVETHCSLRETLDNLNKKLEESESRLSIANQVHML